VKRPLVRPLYSLVRLIGYDGGMLELFAYWARRSLQGANEEAQRFNHEYIGTEHVLLALLKQDGGMAVSILNRLQVNPQKIRAEVEQQIHAGRKSLAKKVVGNALAEAHNLQSKQVDTEHILIALLREEDSVAAQVLESNGITLNRVREEIERNYVHAHYPNLSSSS
jgi:ATP-dependent Clp protease ATP-binding subunit ClpC